MTVTAFWGPDLADAMIDGRYLLGELLGVGGSASVYQAQNIHPDGPRTLAIKILHPHLCADNTARDAFLREARQASRIQHPNVVRVHAWGLHDAGGMVMAWIALDLVRGPTLAEWIGASGRLSPRDAAAIFDGVLAGLAAAHAAGIIHRDVSPQNIVLEGAQHRWAGQPPTSRMARLLDFGLADATGRTTLGSDVLLTESAESVERRVVGTAWFMSPEQAQGLPVRAAADLYQVGAVLYYALTGKPPFPRASTADTLRAHLTAPPPVPSALNPLAHPLDRVVTRAMTKTPARRYRDAEELRAALAEAAAGLSIVHPDATEALGEETAATKLLRPTRSGDLAYLETSRSGLEELPSSTERALPASAGIGVVLAGAVLVALAGFAVWAGAMSGAPGEGASPIAPPNTIIEPAQPDPQDPVAQAVATVPTLHGSLADAEAALAIAGLRLGPVTRIESAEAGGTILAQYPTSGSSLDLGAAVEVTVASGANVIPQVAGMDVLTATALLESAGFQVGRDPAFATDRATATATRPAAGAVLRLGVTVTLTLVEPAPTSGPTGTDPAPNSSRAGVQG